MKCTQYWPTLHFQDTIQYSSQKPECLYLGLSLSFTHGSSHGRSDRLSPHWGNPAIDTTQREWQKHRNPLAEGQILKAFMKFCMVTQISGNIPFLLKKVSRTSFYFLHQLRNISKLNENWQVQKATTSFPHNTYSCLRTALYYIAIFDRIHFFLFYHIEIL